MQTMGTLKGVRMPDDREAVRLNPEYYRKAAIYLLKAAQSGEAAALERIARVSPDTPPALHHAQLTIAREQGFASWPRFRAFLIESSLDFYGLADKFIEAALDDLRSAQEMLARHAEVAGVGFYVALVVGHGSRIECALGESPELATAKGGPRNWEPLLYVCFSRFAGARSKRAADLTATACCWRAVPILTGFTQMNDGQRALCPASTAPRDSTTNSSSRAWCSIGSSSGRWRIAIPFHRTCRPRLLPITAGAGRVGAHHQRRKPYA
jgi:hypothetical protein